MREQRWISSRPELRGDSQGDEGSMVVGYAALFSRPGERFGLSSDLGGFKERIDSRAFDRALADPRLDTKFLVNHDPNLICARVANGSLRLSADAKGLRTEAYIAPTTYGRDLLANIRGGLITQMSFAFECKSETWDKEDDPDTGERIDVRTVREGSILDVSAVTYPAYEDSSIHATDVSSIDPKLLGRSLFPEGVPVEVRSRVPRLNSNAQERRRALTNLVL
jgi:uncharacterized protein